MLNIFVVVSNSSISFLKFSFLSMYFKQSFKYMSPNINHVFRLCGKFFKLELGFFLYVDQCVTTLNTILIYSVSSSFILRMKG